jgi:hypothetical protein
MNTGSQYLHLAENSMLSGNSVYLRIPHSDEVSFIRELWADPETMNPVGGRIMRDDVAPGNTGGQHFLISLGFEQDKSVTNVSRLVMTADRSDTSLP